MNSKTKVFIVCAALAVAFCVWIAWRIDQRVHLELHAGDWRITKADCETGAIEVRHPCAPHDVKKVTIDVGWVNARADAEVCRDPATVYPNLPATLVVDEDGAYTWEDRVAMDCLAPHVPGPR